MDEASEVNQRRWNVLADRHGRGEDTYYDVPAFLAGGLSLNCRERDLVQAAAAGRAGSARAGGPGGVAGLDLLHLQCHFGMDTLSWAREGARVTGVDFSPVALARARELAGQAGLDAEFVEADVLDLPPGLSARFDVVFASYGVLCWIRSAAAWMRSAAAALRPGGALVLIDIHPLVAMMTTVSPPVADFPYAGEVAVQFTSVTSYALGGLDQEVSRTVQWPHGLGEIVTAASGAGLRVESLAEWFDEEKDPTLLVGADGRGRFPLGSQLLPTSYGLTARRPA